MTDNKLWQDIQAQPENLRRVIDHLYGGERPRLEAAARFLRNDRPVAFIGVASAAYLCMPGQYSLGQGGRYASVVYAADALYHLLPMLRRANVVINSRSGETAEIIRLSQALVAEGIPFLAITNEPDSTLARQATHIVWSKTRKDELVSINVVTGMMTTTLALTAAALGRLDAVRADLEQLPEMLGAVLHRAEELREQMLAQFAGVRPIHLLWRGASKAAAYCGRLALEEIARTPGVPVEASEFRQGPNEVVDERFAAVVFASGGRPGQLSRSLAGDLLRQGGRVLLVGEVQDRSSDGPAAAALSLELPAVADILAPVLQIVPLQVLAYALAERQGYAPGEVRYITKVIQAEEGIPKPM
jgi:glutamine---fructose-6-phosphate transaminase (isomerizing)